MDSKFRILEVINQQSNLSQKRIGELCEISSGKVNFIINQLINKGYLISKKHGRKTNYFLTDSGLKYLTQGIESYQNKKVNIHIEPKLDIKQAVILAAGQTKDFDIPVSLLPLGEQNLLNRNLTYLRKYGIEKIVLVTGYKKEAFDFLRDVHDVCIAENKKYKWTGSMASLASAYEFISEDFLLIEHDILIEEDAFKQLIEFPNRDCILLTMESGSGDEAFVELRDGYLYKISKDIHQFNRIDGEMVGISKLSYEVFTKMMEAYKDNKNPYLNYEYLLLDVARQYNIGHIKIHDLVWADIDIKEHYERIVETTFPRLRRKEAEFTKNTIKGLFANGLSIDTNEIVSIEPFGGMTNKSYRVKLSNQKEYVLRTPGEGTEKMINRYEEKYNSSLASSLGIDAELLYFNEATGVKISALIPNAEALNPKTARREDIMLYSTNILRTLHNSGVKMKNEFDVFQKIEEYEQFAIEANGEFYPNYHEVKKQVMKIKEMFTKMEVPIVPCHIDLAPENLVKSGEDKLYLIDWEYSGMNDPMWDIASHSLECSFTPEDEELFLSYYFEQQEPTSEQKLRILMHKILQDFLWSTWTVIKEARGVTFGNYGIDRYNRAIKNINLLFDQARIHN
ncbi:winged helix-turn-helix transcriptional regulator [Bacillus sp. HNG]|uniref:phosphocholine cytidylyltransferase/choline kinase family protein n=1 Tax=Bacillus sp. HNG TaxID=2293325 RepID=UPI000E2FE61E|nr:phosphocholine cytidylyltransferase/choline kinase family protein [Bacillus sp. HNG]RFB11066.1 winged helix-turn-helix transcriptional regulator [Bacillus sp. HNG]